MNIFKNVLLKNISDTNDNINDIIVLEDGEYIDVGYRERPFVFYDQYLFIGHDFDYTFNREKDPELPDAEEVDDTHRSILDRTIGSYQLRDNPDLIEDKALAFGHIINRNVAIIEHDSARNVSMSRVAQELKKRGYKKIYVCNNALHDIQLLRIANKFNLAINKRNNSVKKLTRLTKKKMNIILNYLGI